MARPLQGQSACHLGSVHANRWSPSPCVSSWELQPWVPLSPYPAPPSQRQSYFSSISCSMRKWCVSKSNVRLALDCPGLGQYLHLHLGLPGSADMVGVHLLGMLLPNFLAARRQSRSVLSLPLAALRCSPAALPPAVFCPDPSGVGPGFSEAASS